MKQMTVCLADNEKREIRDLADEVDRSMSEYVARLIREHLEDEHRAEINAQTRVEESMEELVSVGKDELRQTARQIAGMNARMGVYSIANWELIKQSHPDAERRDALSAGSRRLRKSVDESLADEIGVSLDELDDALADSSDADTDADESDDSFSLSDRERVSRGAESGGDD